MTDNSILPPASEDEMRLLLKRSGVELSEELFRQFIAVWPSWEAVVRRIPHAYRYADEPAHIFPTARITKAR